MQQYNNTYSARGGVASTTSKKRMDGAGLGVGGTRGAESAGASYSALSKPWTWLKEVPAQAAQALTSGIQTYTNLKGCIWSSAKHYLWSGAGRMEWPC